MNNILQIVSNDKYIELCKWDIRHDSTKQAPGSRLNIETLDFESIGISILVLKGNSVSQSKTYRISPYHIFSGRKPDWYTSEALINLSNFFASPLELPNVIGLPIDKISTIFKLTEQYLDISIVDTAILKNVIWISSISKEVDTLMPTKEELNNSLEDSNDSNYNSYSVCNLTFTLTLMPTNRTSSTERHIHLRIKECQIKDKVNSTNKNINSSTV